MKVFVLSENNAGKLTTAEHGLSYLIEHEGIRILFDTGQSDLFVKNAAIMGVSLTDIDFIILSHGHFDHGNGLEHLPGGTLICHPGCFINRYRGSDHSYIGLKFSKEELESRFNLITSEEPYRISGSAVFAGEIHGSHPLNHKRLHSSLKTEHLISWQMTALSSLPCLRGFSSLPDAVTPELSTLLSMP